MKVKVDTAIMDMDNNPLFKDEAKKEKLTVKDVIIVCIQTPLKGDDEETAEIRINKFNIMKELHSNKKELELESANVTLIKERILKVYPSPVMYGRMCEAFGDEK